MEREPEPEGCDSNQDCLFHPDGELCDRASKRCVECFVTDHCPGGRTCESGICEGTACTRHDDCEEGTPYCNVAGDACLECLEDGHCGDGICVEGVCEEIPPECTADDECKEEGKPYCVEGSCVSCRDDSTCGEGMACAGEGVCLPNACEAQEDCAAFPGRTCRDGFCGEGDCDDASHCEDPAKPFCLQHRCVECSAAADCPVGSACVAGSCEAIDCVDLVDCPVGSVCEGGTCQGVGPCEEDLDCVDPRLPRCGAEGACVACGSNVDCGHWEQCREGLCEPFDTCRTTSDCKGGFVCQEGACTACAIDEHCPRGSCVAGVCTDAASCSSDAECASGACWNGACVGCAWDQGCVAGLWCEEGSCVGGATCGEGERCPAGTICEEGLCAPVECEDDAYEPDGGFSRARPLKLRSAEGRTICPGDEDWFVFTALEGAVVEAGFFQAPEGTEIALVWFTPDDERRRMEKPGVGGRWVGPLPAAAASRYYLVVRSSGAMGPYLLNVEQSATCTDPFEPNDSVKDAKPLPSNTLFQDLRPCGLGDFYTVDVPAGQTLDVYAFFAVGRLDVQMFNEAGTRVTATTQVITDMGGGNRTTLTPLASDRRITVRLFTPPSASPPSSYALFASVQAPEACGAGPELLRLGERRARVQGATLGVSAGQASACGTLQNRRTYVVQLDEPSRVVAHAEANFRPRLALFDAGCSGALACQGASGLEGTLDIAQVPAGTYVLAVGSEGPQGLFDLSVRVLPPVAPPANNLCSAAAPIDLSTVRTTSGTTEGATSTVVSSCGGLAPDVFYSFDLTEDRRVVFDLARHNAPLAMFLLDDACTPVAEQCTAERRLDAELAAGRYRLGIAATSGKGTSFELTSRSVVTPANDTCAAAQPIGRSMSVVGDTTWARNDSDAPIVSSCTGYLLGGNDVFYRIDLQKDVPVTFTATPGPGYDVALYVLSGCVGGQCLQGVDAVLQGEEETLVFTPSEDGTYYVVVDGAKGGGTFGLAID